MASGVLRRGRYCIRFCADSAILASAEWVAGLPISAARYSSPVACRLELEKLRVAPARGEQLVVSAHGFDLALGEDEDAVGHADARETMRDEHGGLPVAQLLEALEHFELGPGVERRGGLVEDEEL